MPDIVGVDTLLAGDPPEQAANFSGLASFAAKTQSDWETDLTNAELNRWGDAGILGALFAGLAQGKPFIAALIEAILQYVFPEYDEIVATVEQGWIDLAGKFNGRWRDIVAAKDAADYANAQLAVSTRPIKDLFDGAAGNLGGDWDIDYFDSVGGLAAGTVKQDGKGNAWWDGFGIAARTGRCRFQTVGTATDDQVVTVVMPLRVQPPALLTGKSAMRLLGRVNSAGTTFVYAEITNDSVELGCVVSGSKTTWASAGTATQDGDVWDFYSRDRFFSLRRNGLVIIDYDDTGSVSTKGSSNRFVGFEMFANSRGLLGQTSPGTLAVFSADDY